MLSAVQGARLLSRCWSLHPHAAEAVIVGEVEHGALERQQVVDEDHGRHVRRDLDFGQVDRLPRRAAGERLAPSAVANQGMRTLLAEGKLAVLIGRTTADEGLRAGARVGADGILVQLARKVYTTSFGKFLITLAMKRWVDFVII